MDRRPNARYFELIAPVECAMRNTNRIADISGWLKGAGKVTFANRQGGFYYARVNNQIAFEKILRGHQNRMFMVNFRCQPFFYLSGVKDITITSSSTTVTNPGNIYSEPVITVTGTGDITLMVGMQIVELEGISSSIVIDSELVEAYRGSSSMNKNMSGDFPTLAPGSNAISWTGNVTKVVVKPNWRYI